MIISITPTLIQILRFLTTTHYANLIRSEAHKLGLAVDEYIVDALTAQAPICVGVSGGKDSDALAILLDQFLSAIYYTGEKLLIHADLGDIEHVESIDQVHKLAAFLGWKLKIVRRQKGGLLERYEQRWRDNCKRWANLECVTLISPWPSATSRFCTSETKIAPITQAAVKLFPGKLILNAIGIRAEESAQRAKKPISKQNDKLTRADGTQGRDWLPLLNISLETVWLTHHKANFPRHIQYDRGNERLSCSFCFLASLNDWRTGAAVPTNLKAYTTLSNLEIRSGFSYNQQNWLADVRPDILPDELRNQIAPAKEIAQRRKLIELRIPRPMLFSNSGGQHGWPSFQPTMDQCEILASVRRDVATLIGDEIRATTNQEILYTTATAIYDRYAELLIQRAAQTTKKNKRLRITPATPNALIEIQPAESTPTIAITIPPHSLPNVPAQSLLF